MARLGERSTHGKLIEAARYWVQQGDPERDAALKDAQDLLKSLREWKAGPEQTDPVEQEIERLQAAEDFEVHEDNMESVGLFLDLGTQWRFVSTLGGVHHTGMNYPSAESVLRIRRVPPARRERLFDDLRVMEDAALNAMRERAETDKRAGAAAVARGELPQ